jgi:ornithine decarboxylase
VDVIREEIMLPDLAIGELVVGRVMGAYTWASASTFNFFPKASILILDSAQQGQKLVAAA